MIEKLFGLFDLGPNVFIGESVRVPSRFSEIIVGPGMVQVVPACLAHVANKSDAHISIRVGIGLIRCPHSYSVCHCERDITTAATVICLLPYYLKSFGMYDIKLISQLLR